MSVCLLGMAFFGLNVRFTKKSKIRNQQNPTSQFLPKGCSLPGSFPAARAQSEGKAR